MGLSKSILRNVLTEWLSKFISIISVILITPILIKNLGRYDYGLWVLIGQGVSLLVLVDFGIASSVSRFISKYSVLNKPEYLNKIYSTSMAMFFTSTLIALIMVLILLPIVPDILNIVEDRVPLAKILIGLLGAGIVFNIPLRVGRGMLESVNRFDIISSYQLVSSIVNLGIIVLVFNNSQYGLLFLGVLSLCINSSVELLIFLHSRKYHPNIRFAFAGIQKPVFKEIFSLSSSSAVQSVTALLNNQLNILFVGIIIGVQYSPLFSIPCMLIIRMSPFVSKLGATFTPIASGMHAKKQHEGLNRLNILGVKYGLAISFPIAVFFIFFASRLFHLWLGPAGMDFYEISTITRISIIMVVCFAISRPHIASRTMLKATGNHWFVANYLVTSSIAGLVLSIILMKYTSLGILGAPIGWSLKTLGIDGIIFPLKICKQLNISKVQYFFKIYSEPFASAIVLSALACILVKFNWGHELTDFMIKTGIYGTFSMFLFYFILDKNHRPSLNKGR